MIRTLSERPDLGGPKMVEIDVTGLPCKRSRLTPHGSCSLIRLAINAVSRLQSTRPPRVLGNRKGAALLVCLSVVTRSGPALSVHPLPGISPLRDCHAQEAL